MIIIRKMTADDVAAVDRIYQDARIFMRQNGNMTQWNGVYPNGEDAADDVRRGIGYVACEDGCVIAAFAFFVGEERTYRRIDGGNWRKAGPYGVIHRIAVAHHGRGIAAHCFDFCYRQIQNLRIDTHRDNLAMQRALEKNGFAYCGIIYLENGDERLAYQKCE